MGRSDGRFIVTWSSNLKTMMIDELMEEKEEVVVASVVMEYLRHYMALIPSSALQDHYVGLESCSWCCVRRPITFLICAVWLVLSLGVERSDQIQEMNLLCRVSKLSRMLIGVSAAAQTT